MDTEDWTTVRTGRSTIEDGDPQLEKRARAKAGAREKLRERFLACEFHFLIEQFPQGGPVADET